MPMHVAVEITPHIAVAVAVAGRLVSLPCSTGHTHAHMYMQQSCNFLCCDGDSELLKNWTEDVHSSHTTQLAVQMRGSHFK
ncbi:hypothetical protein ABZP36_001027 [Zizania latifolia]